MNLRETCDIVMLNNIVSLPTHTLDDDPCYDTHHVPHVCIFLFHAV